MVRTCSILVMMKAYRAKWMDKTQRWIVGILLVLAAVIRLKVYWQNRSLFIDEASLARNLAEKSYVDFFGPLAYDQFAPPLFMIESKMVSQLWGMHEQAVRLLPLLASLACLYLVYETLRKLCLHPISIIWGLGMIGLSVYAIRYATEFKQYSGDSFVCALLLHAVIMRDQEWSWRSVVFWVIFGGMCILYSMPSVFILSGVGFHFLSKAESARSRLKVLLVGGMWLLCFGAYYFLVLREGVESGYLQDYFDERFLDVGLSSWRNNLRLLQEPLVLLADKTALGVGLGTLLLIAGFWRMRSRLRAWRILLTVPLLVFLLAVCMRQYPVSMRLILFLLPLLIVIACAGLDAMWHTAPYYGKGLLILLIVVSIANKKGHSYLYQKMTFEELRPGLHLLKSAIKPGDVIYVDHEAIPAFEFYQKDYISPFGFSGTIVRGEWDSDPSEILEVHSDDRIWCLFSHSLESEIQRNLRTLPTNNLNERYRAERTALYLLEK